MNMAQVQVFPRNETTNSSNTIPDARSSVPALAMVNVASQLNRVLNGKVNSAYVTDIASTGHASTQ